jgi:hypothetical protein
MDADILLLKLEDFQRGEQIVSGLRAAGINVLVENLSIANNVEIEPKESYRTEIHLTIAQSDLAKARQVILEQELPVYKDRNYLLPFFSDEELRDIITKPEIWGAYHYHIAKELLKQRCKKQDL